MDTIVAVATPRGRGAMGIVRLSGGESARIAGGLTGRPRAFVPRMATLARVAGLDEVIVTFFQSPSSFTGEDVVEICAHGSPVVLDALVERAIALGARHARPGEFSFRAVLNGRMDLAQAEAVADLIQAETRQQAAVAFDQLDGALTERIRELEREVFEVRALLEASLDFPDEGYKFIEAGAARSRLESLLEKVDALLSNGRSGRLVREGARVLFVGPRNAGKSSLFNRLLGFGRALVSDSAGTTRDLVSESVELEGLLLHLVDAAGLGEPSCEVEADGMRRTLGALESAQLVLSVVDGSRGEGEVPIDVSGGSSVLVVVNKVDLGLFRGSVARERGWIPVSAVTGEGVDELRGRMVGALRGGESAVESPVVSNRRHLSQLVLARERLVEALGRVKEGAPEEFVLTCLAEVGVALEEIAGVRSPAAVLDEVFARFCIGK